MTVQRTVYTSPIEALTALIRSLVAYEHYQMSSSDFYTRYQRGEMGDTAEMIEWAGDYQHYVQLKEELEQSLWRLDNDPCGVFRRDIPAHSSSRWSPYCTV